VSPRGGTDAVFGTSILSCVLDEVSAPEEDSSSDGDILSTKGGNGVISDCRPDAYKFVVVRGESASLCGECIVMCPFVVKEDSAVLAVCVEGPSRDEGGESSIADPFKMVGGPSCSISRRDLSEDTY